jgi:hypothetical protein
MLLLGHLLGQLAGITILVNGRNPVITGILTGLEVLATTGFLSGLYGFFLEGILSYRPIIGAFLGYIVKPFFWIVFWGFIPAIVVGVWFGVQIRKKGALHHSQQIRDTDE